MKKFIRVNEHVLEAIELNDQTVGPFIGKILKLAGLTTLAERYDEFSVQVKKETTIQGLLVWISRNANVSYDEARIGYKRAVLIWCLYAIIVEDTFKYQLEMLKNLTHTYCFIISPHKTKISIEELQRIFREEDIEAYECYEYFQEFSQFSEKFLSVIN